MLEQRDKRTLFLGAIALAVMLLFTYVAMPMFDHWREMSTQLNAAEVKMVEYQQELLRIKSKTATLESIYGKCIKNELPTTDEARQKYFKAFERLLQESGIRKRVVNAQPIKPFPGNRNLQLVGIKIKGQCKPDRLLQCMSKMNEFEKLVLIDNVQIAKMPKGDQLEVSLIASLVARAEK
ncbi:hypothetical protein JD969_16900 [Planctomycetota bacterium]|nr:hypothetical protein JD969_16900 [Planctomycetota bacterium]